MHAQPNRRTTFEPDVHCIPVYEHEQLIDLFQLKDSPPKQEITRSIIKRLSFTYIQLHCDARIERVIHSIRKNYYQKIDLKKYPETFPCPLQGLRLCSNQKPEAVFRNFCCGHECEWLLKHC